MRFVCFVLSTADIVAMHVSQFQKDRDEQARYEFERVIFMSVRISVLSTDDIVEMKVSKFQKDRDEQARTEFELVLSMNVRFVCFALSTADIVAMLVLCVFAASHSSLCSSLYSSQFRLHVSQRVSHTDDIVEIKVSQFQKDRDEQAGYEFEHVISMNARISGLSTDDIVEMKVCQFQRDRDEQAQRKFEFGLSIWNLQLATRIVHHLILRGVRIGEASHPGPRLRRRGPRSLNSRANRRSRGEEICNNTEPKHECSEDGLIMLHLNLRGYLSHIAEVTALVRGMIKKPFLVTLNETFLNKAIEHVQLEGYQVLARRDREGQWGGGILVFVLDEYAPRVTLVETSESAERIWAIVHSDRGPYLVCCWYRPPKSGDVVSIESFEAEYAKHKDGAVGVFVLGDLNVHSIRWLRHSARETVEGRVLHDISSKLGLRQVVRQPTRGEYLLDLVLTDVLDCQAKPCAAVADHRGVLTKVKFTIPETASHQREAWYYTDADWDRLTSNIEDTD